MTRNIFRIATALTACLALFAASAITASAEDDARDTLEPSRTKGPYYEHSENEMRARKLARGFANMAFCVAEIPNQAFREAQRTSPIPGTIVGIGKGFVKGAKRLAIGAWEIATFYAPMNNNYKPYVEPEVVFMEDLH